MAAMALQIPRARERCAGSRKVMVRMVKVAGDKTAAPRPCRARAPTSMNWFWATAQTRLAPANRNSPSMKMRRRPKRSAARPPRSRKPPKDKA